MLIAATILHVIVCLFLIIVVLLQSGKAAVQFSTTAAEPVAITVTNAAGAVVGSATMQATAGANTWSWDGTNPQGGTNPDGTYTVSVTNAASGANNAAIPFTVVGTATGITQSGGTTNIAMGGLSVPFSSLVSVQ